MSRGYKRAALVYKITTRKHGLSLLPPIQNADIAKMVLRPESRGPSKILIVDDLPCNLQLLSTALTESGYRVRNATSGSAAIKDIATEPPDLILMALKFVVSSIATLLWRIFQLFL